MELSRLWQLPQLVERQPSAARACGELTSMRGGVQRIGIAIVGQLQRAKAQDLGSR